MQARSPHIRHGAGPMAGCRSADPEITPSLAPVVLRYYIASAKNMRLHDAA